MKAPRPRVLHVIGSLDVGGAERQIVEIVRGLADRYDFHVGVSSPGGPLETDVRSAGAKIYALSTRADEAGAFRRAGRFLRARKRLRVLLSTLRPDVVHSWLFETSLLSAASRWPGRTPPLIVSKRSLVEWIARHRRYVPLARWTNARADVLLANSEAVRSDAIRKEGVDPGRIQVIHNGVDTSIYAPGPADPDLRRRLGLAEGPVVGMVANLHRYKGHREVVEAAATLWGEGRRFSLLLVGRDGDATDALRAQVARLGVAQVVFAGPRADVPEVLRLMDVFVSASHEEGFSNSILEAMSSARAIVATSVGGNVEQITDGVTGLVVPPRAPASLAAALRLLLDDPGLRVALAGAARARVLATFSLDHVLEETAALYERLLRG